MEIPLSLASDEQEFIFPAFNPGLRGALWQSASTRWFLLSECLRMFSVYFTAIALPWLVMQSTGSAAFMGASILLTGAGRVALVMVFGALCDRWSPRALLIIAGVLRAGLLGLGALLAAMGGASAAALIALCLGFGLVDAVFLPARGAITPRLVPEDQIAPLNALSASMDQLWGLAGPGLAGLLITFAGRAAGAASEITGAAIPGAAAPGAAAALLAAGLAALLALLLLLPVRASQPACARPHTAGKDSSGGSMRHLLAFLRQERGVLAAFLMVYGIGAVSATPFAVLMPMLAVSRYTDGAGAMGLLTSALSAGTLFGALASGLFPLDGVTRIANTGRALFAVFLCALTGFAGSIFVLFTGAPLPAAGFALALAAALIGYVNVSGLSQIQRGTPPELLGKMIGLLHLK